MQVGRRHLTAAAAVCLAFASAAAGEVKTKTVDYKQGTTVLQGLMAWDDAKPGKRPGILVIHEWWGHNEHARQQATRLAEAGYVAFALDMYGKGKQAAHPKEAEAFMNEVINAQGVIAARFNAALDELKKDPHVDATKIAAIGYCFGGAVALEMARAGADLDAVVGLHAALDTKTPAQKGKIKARILVLNGADDPMVPAAQVQAFEQEMKAAGANYQVVTYPGVKHGYTNPKAGTYGVPGLAYDEHATHEAWNAMVKFLGDAMK